jgi:hypothetical protein
MTAQFVSGRMLLVHLTLADCLSGTHYPASADGEGSCQSGRRLLRVVTSVLEHLCRTSVDCGKEIPETLHNWQMTRVAEYGALAP